MPINKEIASKLFEDASANLKWVCPVTRLSFNATDIEGIEAHKKKTLQKLEEQEAKQQLTKIKTDFKIKRYTAKTLDELEKEFAQALGLTSKEDVVPLLCIKRTFFIKTRDQLAVLIVSNYSELSEKTRDLLNELAVGRPIFVNEQEFRKNYFYIGFTQDKGELFSKIAQWQNLDESARDFKTSVLKWVMNCEEVVRKKESLKAINEQLHHLHDVHREVNTEYEELKKKKAKEMLSSFEGYNSLLAS